MAPSDSGLRFDYDVFLSHSSADKPVVEEIAHRLLQESVRPFLDKWHLVPGDVWEEGLEEGLDASRTFAVFVGPDGIAPWQNEEMRSALSDRVRDRSRRVIPVLLPAAERPASKDLPRFLRRATWVDLSDGVDEDGLRLLICGVKGLQPGPPEALPEREAPTTDERLLRGKVYHLGADNEPVAETGFEVVCEETGKPATTDDHGFFDLPLPTAFQQGETVTLQVKKTGWRVRYPVNGEVTLPADLAKTRVPIELLPNGSKLFLTHDQIEALIERISEESAREAQRSTTEHEPKDFGDAIRAWADVRGLDPDQAREAVAAWVEETKDKSQDPRRLGLAAVAEKRFTEAADLFETAAGQGLQRLEAMAEEEDRIRRQVVDDLRRQGDALSTAYRFRDAIAAYQRALDQARRDQMPNLWAATQNHLGNALWGEGIRCAPMESASYLDAAVLAYRRALEVYTHGELPYEWAKAQNNLGIALKNQGIRTGGEAGQRLLEQAIEAYGLALEIYSRDQMPLDWAKTKNNLGIALVQQANRTENGEALRIFEQAVEAIRGALEVYSRDEPSHTWAQTQNNLGNFLAQQAIRTQGEEADQLLEQAIEAYRMALKVRTREELPQGWAQTQNNLGNALKEQGIRAEGDAGRTLLGQAIDAYHLALEVRTRAELPQGWAMTQNNLGTALRQKGMRTEGEPGRRLLDRAARAHRLALAVYTREDLPQDWARTQDNLGSALQEQGVRTQGEEGRSLLQEAVSAFKRALEIHTREHLPRQWEKTYRNLGTTLLLVGRVDEAETVFAELGEPVPDLAVVSGDNAGEPGEPGES